MSSHLHGDGTEALLEIRRPMSFNPCPINEVEIVNVQQPSTYDHASMAASLGFGDDINLDNIDAKSCDSTDTESESDNDEKDHVNENIALKKQLQLEVQLKEKAMLMLKTSETHNYHLDEQLKKQQQNTKTQISIVRGSRASALKEKERALENLQFMLEQAQRRIRVLENSEEYEEEEDDATARLLAHIDDLTAERSALSERSLLAELDLKNATAALSALKEELNDERACAGTTMVRAIENDISASGVHVLPSNGSYGNAALAAAVATTAATAAVVANQEVKRLGSEVERLENELSYSGALPEAMKELHSDVERLRKETADLEKKNESLVEEVNQEKIVANYLKKEKEDLTEQLKLSALSQTESSGATNHLTEENEKLTRKLDLFESETVTLKKSLYELSEKLKAIEKEKMSLVENETTTLKKSRDDLTETLKATEKENSSLKKANDELIRKLEEVEASVDVFKADTMAASELSAANQATMASQESILKEMKASLMITEATLAERGLALKDAESALLDSQAILVATKNTLSVAEASIATQEASLKETNDALVASQANEYALEIAKNEAESSLSTFRQQSEDLILKLRAEISEIEGLNITLRDENAEALSQAAEVGPLRERLSLLIEGLNAIGDESTELSKERNLLKNGIASFRTVIINEIQEGNRKIKQSLTDMEAAAKCLLIKYRKEMRLRKKLHNELVELKGNIRVFCRVRPLIESEITRGENVVSFDKEDDNLMFVSSKGMQKMFEFDKIFHPNSTQQNVFDEIAPLIISCIDGFNVCIFAYGQTGSGKTHTMEGPSEDPGVNTRALNELFSVTTEKSDFIDFTISVSVVEIYNETVRDLLKVHDSKMEIRQGSDGMYVPGLQSVPVANAEDVCKVTVMAHRNRATASTNMNEHSSRSHALVQVQVEGINKFTGARTVGKLNLVDLAGSERLSKSEASGDRMKEAQNINRSLSALGDVISSLVNKSSHTPYRNSKLTYLLQDSLGGDSKTLMFVQISPSVYNVGESMCSLNFASRVRSVELGRATRRVDESSEITILRERIRELEHNNLEVAPDTPTRSSGGIPGTPTKNSSGLPGTPSKSGTASKSNRDTPGTPTRNVSPSKSLRVSGGERSIRSSQK